MTHELDHVLVGPEVDVVLDAHGRQNDAERTRILPAHLRDVFEESTVSTWVDDRDQAVADVDAEAIHVQEIADSLFFAWFGRCGLCIGFAGLLFIAALLAEGHQQQAAAEQRER